MNIASVTLVGVEYIIIFKIPPQEMSICNFFFQCDLSKRNLFSLEVKIMLKHTLNLINWCTKLRAFAYFLRINENNELKCKTTHSEER